MNRKIDICGVGIDNINLEQAAEAAMELAQLNFPKTIFTPNAAILLQCLKNEAFKHIINSADLCIPDGEGVLYAARKQRKVLCGKVAGVDLAFALLKRLDKIGGSLFIYGGTPSSLSAALERVNLDYPCIRVEGIDGYTYTKDAAIIKINSYAADVVFVCLGCPNQEYFIANNKEKFIRGLFIGLGGTVDIISKKAKRAPKWIIDCRFEWLWRSVIEPKRLLKLVQLLEYRIKLKKYLKIERFL